VDRLEAGKATTQRIQDSVATAFTAGQGRMAFFRDDRQEPLPFDQRPICPHCNTPYPALEARLLDFNDPTGACPTCGGTGVIQKGRKGKSSGLAQTCSDCQGTRLNLVARSMTIPSPELNFADVCTWECNDLLAWCRNQGKLSGRDGELLGQIMRRLEN